MYADFDGCQTWYEIVGELNHSLRGGPAPLVVVHGGPGATHEYLLPLADLAEFDRPVVFYDQIGNGNSTHLSDRGAEFWTVDLFARELTSLIEHLGIGDRYHLLGQSWGGMLAQEHAIGQPFGLRRLVLSNTAVSFAAFAVAANALRAGLPAGVDAILRRHEARGTTDDPEYAEACRAFYDKHLCRVQPWPDEVLRSFQAIADDPTVYHTTNGPSEFHIIGSFKDFTTHDRLDRIEVPTLVISGYHDEATPAAQVDLVQGITHCEQVILENSSHMPFWEEREAYMRAVGEFLQRGD